jgi:putative Ca2+/H+ antiporter (TMEM165/GDT1 family)
MDLKLIATTFITVFLAELGDKTQLATVSFAASGSSRVAVFIGSAAALVCSSAIAVALGEGLTKLVAPKVLMRIAGGLFFVVGGWVLWSSRA